MSQKVYLISGTLGSGKSAVSKMLSIRLRNSVLIEADDYLHQTQGDSNLSWPERLEYMWSQVIKLAVDGLDNHKDVVIDGLIEDELPQLQAAFQNQDIYYCILIANENVIEQRIAKRGDQHSLARSKQVLNQFRSDKSKAPYLLNTSLITPEEVLNHILKLQPLHLHSEQ